MELTGDNRLFNRQAEWACLTLLLLATLSWGCGGDGEPSLRHYSGEITVAAGALEVSVESHYTAMHDATSLDEMHDLEAHHSQDALAFMGSMHDAEYSLQSCGQHMRNTMYAPLLGTLDESRQAMHKSMNEIELEIEHHADVIGELQSINAIAEEEDRHHGAMLNLLDQMAVHSDEMLAAMDSTEREGMSMMCSMGTHMHHSW